MHIYTYIYIYIIVGFSYDTPARKYLKYKLKHFCTKKERCRRQASFYQPLTLCRPRKVQISDSSAIIYVLLRSLVVAPCELELVRICIEHLLFRVTCVCHGMTRTSVVVFSALIIVFGTQAMQVLAIQVAVPLMHKTLCFHFILGKAVPKRRKDSRHIFCGLLLLLLR